MFVVLHVAGYQDALAKFTLKKFLLLVLFLDKAKTAHLIGYNPCLFCKDSDYKVCKSCYCCCAHFLFRWQILIIG